MFDFGMYYVQSAYHTKDEMNAKFCIKLPHRLSACVYNNIIDPCVYEAKDKTEQDKREAVHSFLFWFVCCCDAYNIGISFHSTHNFFSFETATRSTYQKLGGKVCFKS